MLFIIIKTSLQIMTDDGFHHSVRKFYYYDEGLWKLISSCLGERFLSPGTMEFLVTWGDRISCRLQQWNFSSIWVALSLC
jgi:hypothetical protein